MRVSSLNFAFCHMSCLHTHTHVCSFLSPVGHGLVLLEVHFSQAQRTAHMEGETACPSHHPAANPHTVLSECHRNSSRPAVWASLTRVTPDTWLFCWPLLSGAEPGSCAGKTVRTSGSWMAESAASPPEPWAVRNKKGGRASKTHSQHFLGERKALF